MRVGIITPGWDSVSQVSSHSTQREYVTLTQKVEVEFLQPENAPVPYQLV